MIGAAAVKRAVSPANVWRRPVARWTVLALASVVSVGAVGCTGSPPPPYPSAVAEPVTTPIARSRHGMVVSGSAIASDVGARVLEAGGNAVDAAVATAFALAVVEPTMSGLGGRTQVLIRSAEGAFAGIDGTTQVPEGYTRGAVGLSDDAYGYRTIGVPGTVAALARALDEHGTWKWDKVLAPAIALAREGFVVAPLAAGRFAAAAPRLAEFEGSRRHFLKPDGSPYQAGDRLVQSALARTLQTLADEGSDAFYHGVIADQMARDIVSNGGFVARGDLAEYRARPALVVHGSYRGLELVGTYLPASGATTIEALHILENFDPGVLADPVSWAAIVAQALLLSFEDRERALGSAEFQAQALVSKPWAATRARAVRVWPLPTSGAGTPARRSLSEPEHTTHLSVTDRWGGAVALTQSLGPSMGSKVASPEFGFLYAATMGYLSAAAPRDRAWSSQSPMVLQREGKPAYVLGAAGARRIISAVVQVVSRMVDWDLSLAAAMAAPRLHPTDATWYLEMRPEATWSETDLADLRARGHPARGREEGSYFARLHGIEIDGLSGHFIGVADPRGTGAAAAARR